jgi:hypothetical protein
MNPSQFLEQLDLSRAQIQEDEFKKSFNNIDQMSADEVFAFYKKLGCVNKTLDSDHDFKDHIKRACTDMYNEYKYNIYTRKNKDMALDDLVSNCEDIDVLEQLYSLYDLYHEIKDGNLSPTVMFNNAFKKGNYTAARWILDRLDIPTKTWDGKYDYILYHDSCLANKKHLYFNTNDNFDMLMRLAYYKVDVKAIELLLYTPKIDRSLYNNYDTCYWEDELYYHKILTFTESCWKIHVDSGKQRELDAILYRKVFEFYKTEHKFVDYMEKVDNLVKYAIYGDYPKCVYELKENKLFNFDVTLHNGKLLQLAGEILFVKNDIATFEDLFKEESLARPFMQLLFGLLSNQDDELKFNIYKLDSKVLDYVLKHAFLSHLYNWLEMSVKDNNPLRNRLYIRIVEVL